MPSDPRAELEAWRAYSEKTGWWPASDTTIGAMWRYDSSMGLGSGDIAALLGSYERAARLELQKHYSSFQMQVTTNGYIVWDADNPAWNEGPTLADAFIAALKEAQA